MANDKKYLSKIKKTIGGVKTDIYLKDAEARQEIADIKTSITGAMHWRGYTTTELTDGATTNPITIGGESYTAVAGDVVAVQGSGSGQQADKEFVFNGTKWEEYGSTGSLKALAFKDSATGSVTAAGSNGTSQVTFGSNAGSDFVTGYNNDGVAPSFQEGAFTPASIESGFVSAGTAPSFSEGAFTPASLGSGFYTEGSNPSFSEGAFTPASLGSGFVTPGSAASYSHSGFSGGSLGDATKSAFATEGEKSTYDEANECLEFDDASTSQAVTAQGTFTPAVYGTDTFNGGTPTAIDTTKFNGGSKAADTFNAGSKTTLDLTKFNGGSKAADTFNAGTTPSVIDTTKFSGGSKAADTFSAGSAATLAKAKALTKDDTGTAAAQTFTGSAVSVTVS